MKFILHKTCPACPEQYDVYHEGLEVGYLRLRHGIFRVECPRYTVLYCDLTGGDGEFLEVEREVCLRKAVRAIAKKLSGGPLGGPISYTVVDQLPGNVNKN